MEQHWHGYVISLHVFHVGGEQLIMNYKQEKATDYVENQDILKALGIDAKVEANEGSAPTVSTLSIAKLYWAV